MRLFITILFLSIALSSFASFAWAGDSSSPIKITIEYIADATSVTIKLSHSAPITKEGEANGTKAGTKQIETTLVKRRGAIFVLDKVALAEDGWVEVGERPGANGKTLVVFTKTVPTEVPATKQEEVGEAYAKVDLILNPSTDGETLSLDPKYEKLKFKFKAARGLSAEFKKEKTDQFKNEVTQELNKLISKLKGSSQLTNEKVEALLNKGKASEDVEFIWFGKERAAKVDMTFKFQKRTNKRLGL